MVRSLPPEPLRELAQEAHVVLEEELDIADAVFPHGETLDAHAEGEAGKLLGVVVHEAIDGWVHHAGAEQLNPAGELADAAAAAAAHVAASVYFSRGFGEREVPGPQARLDLGPEKLHEKGFDGPLQTAKAE